MASIKNLALFSLLIVLISSVAELQEAQAVTCSVFELSSCQNAIVGTEQPSELCCQKLREQQPCFCGYLQNPLYSGFLSSATARQAVATCGAQIPTNC